MGLNLPPIRGAGEFDPSGSATPENPDGDEDDFDFEAIPFKADYMYKDASAVKKLIQGGDKTFGVPAASLSWGIDGNRMIPSIAIGKEGEKQTASLLDRMAKEIPEMFVFHSLSWPESQGDTDHIVIYGDLLLVVDSKRWKSSRKYSIRPDGAILRGTVPFPSGRVRIGSAVKTWRKKYPMMKVQGIVTIAQEKVFVSRDKNWYRAPYRLVEYDKLEEFLREAFAKHKKKPVSGKLLMSLGMLLVKERRRVDEIVRAGGERRSNDL